MKHLIITMPVLLVSLVFCSAEATPCRKDKTFTWRDPATYEFYIVPDDLYCPNCRDVLRFPQDVINYMWNLTVRSADFLPQDEIMYDIAGAMYNADWGDQELTVPVCNDHGQCASATLAINFNRISIPLWRGFGISQNTSVRNIVLTVRTTDGRTHSANYLPRQVEIKPEFPVPSDSTEDTYPEEVCMNNYGERIENHTARDHDLNGVEYYVRFFNQQEAAEEEYNNLPKLQCGYSLLDDGTRSRSCIWTNFY